MSALLAALLFAAQDAPALSAPVPESKARVVFFRTGGFYYGRRGCPLYEDRAGKPVRIGGVDGGRYAAIEVEPGSRDFAASERFKRPVRVALTAGETQFVRCQLSGFPGSPKLELSHRIEFERYAKDLKPAE